MPDVSIIIPCYNAAPFLREAVDSALAQAVDGLEAEVIVVDDGSTDESRKILAGYADRIRLIEQANQGACAARNRGWREAQAPRIKFLDADDRLVPKTLLKEINWQNQQPDSQKNVISFTDARIVDSQGRCLLNSHFKLSPVSRPLSSAELVRRAPLTPMPLFPREALAAVSGFDPTMPAAQEYDLHVRLHFSGWRFVLLPWVGSEYRSHASSERVSRRALSSEAFQGRLGGYKKHLAMAESELDGEESAELAAAFAGIFWSTGRFALRCHLPDVAEEFFKEARSLSTAVPFGSRGYRCACACLGPRMTERLAAFLRRVRFPAKSQE